MYQSLTTEQKNMYREIIEAEIGDRLVPVTVTYEHEDACEDVGFYEGCVIEDMESEYCSEDELLEWWGENQFSVECRLLEMWRERDRILSLEV